MDIHKKIAKELINKNFSEAKDAVFQSLYAKASLALDEARFAVANAVFNTVEEEATEEIEEDLQTPARERDMTRKAIKAMASFKPGLFHDRSTKIANQKAASEATRIRKKSEKEKASKKTYGRGGKVVKEDAEQLDETMTRKHFQQVADVIKAHPDAKKREELAAHHSQIFKKSNPRFDQTRFNKACGVGGCK